MNKYTGIGSRSTPKEVLEQMNKISLYFYRKGFILRSGRAQGADFEGFEKPLLPYMKDKQVAEIFLSWNNFENNCGVEKAWHDGKNYFTFTNLDKKVQNKAMKLAESFHENWAAVSDGVKLLLARDICQCLGADLKSPSKFVVVYTAGGAEIGGSRIAIRTAKKYKIPLFNLGSKTGLEDLRKYTKKLFDK